MKTSLGGQQIYFEVFGQGEDVLLLHGWGTDHRIWHSFLPYLSTIPCRFITIDLPGFGESYPLIHPFTTKDYTQIIRSLADDLELSKELTLVGHSFGGKIALAYARQNPLKKLILIDSAGIKRRSFRTQTILAAATLLKLLNLKPLNALRQKLAARFQADDYRQLDAPVLRETFRLTVAEDWREKIKGIHVPTLIIWGSDDDTTPLRDAVIMKRAIKDSRLKIIPESGHFPFLDQPEITAKVMTDFILSPNL